MLINAGVDIKTVNAQLGHTTIKETGDPYGWLYPSADDKTRDAIEKKFERKAQ